MGWRRMVDRCHHKCPHQLATTRVAPYQAQSHDSGLLAARGNTTRGSCKTQAIRDAVIASSRADTQRDRISQ